MILYYLNSKFVIQISKCNVIFEYLYFDIDEIVEFDEMHCR